MFFSGSRYVSPIALDLGFDSIKMAQLIRCRGQIRILAAKKIRFPRRLRQGPEQSYQRTHFAVQAVDQALKSGKFKGHRAMLCVGKNVLDSACIRFDDSAEQNERHFIQAHARREFGLWDHEGAVDYLPAGEVRNGLEIHNEYLAFGGSDEALQEQLAILEDMNLHCQAIEPKPCSVFRCFLDESRQADADNEFFILVDMGARSTVIVTAGGEQITWTRQIEFGGCDLTDLVAQKLQLDTDDALEMRLQSNRKLNNNPLLDWGRKQVDLVLTDIIREKIEELAEEIKLSQQHHQQRFGGKAPAEIWFCGGEAYATATQSLLGKSLHKKIRTKCCLEALDCSSLELDDLAFGNQFSEWAAVFGLCLKNLQQTQNRNLVQVS
ncbi:MAG: pilus assembly protein PilM [Sedimentisphaerales bacterium]|nr:pilus assembly protein PilM [Sedimentisphaerales bacterium]